MLTWVRIPDAAMDFSSRANFQCRLSYGVSAAPVYVIVSINICAQVKNSKTLVGILLFGHTKILHTLVGMGSAALADAVL